LRKPANAEFNPTFSKVFVDWEYNRIPQQYTLGSGSTQFVCISAPGAGVTRGVDIHWSKPSGGEISMHFASNPGFGQDLSVWWFGYPGQTYRFTGGENSQPYYGGWLYTSSPLSGGSGGENYIPGARIDKDLNYTTRNWTTSSADGLSTVSGYEILDSNKLPGPVWNSGALTPLSAAHGQSIDASKDIVYMRKEV